VLQLAAAVSRQRIAARCCGEADNMLQLAAVASRQRFAARCCDEAGSVLKLVVLAMAGSAGSVVARPAAL
jgi:hypothetical protein